MIYFIYPNVDIWEYMVEGIDITDVVCRPLNPSCHKWQVVMRKALKNATLPAWMLFGKQMRKELKCLKKGDTVLISDYTEPCLFKAFNASVAPGVRKCLWIWNPVRPSAYEQTVFRYKQIESAGFNISTFDKGDAERFHQKLYSQFFRMKQEATEDKEEYDFYFIGFEKNRGSIIYELREKLKGYRTCFRVVHSVEECIPYAENMKNIQKARCIIEIVQNGQKGTTLRPLEALACGKKLMTNNKFIKEYDFYLKENIFIIGEDDFSTIDTFIQTPFTPLLSTIVDKYDISSWLSNYKK